MLQDDLGSPLSRRKKKVELLFIIVVHNVYL